MLKKIAIILFAGLLVFAMVACKAKDGEADTNGSSTTAPSSNPSAPVEGGDENGDDFTSKQESNFVDGVDPDLDFGDSTNGSSSGVGSSTSNGDRWTSTY